VISRFNSVNFAYVWSVPERNNVFYNVSVPIFAYGWSVPKRNNVFYNVSVPMPSMGFEPWSLCQVPCNGLSVVDVNHYTKSSDPPKTYGLSADIVTDNPEHETYGSWI
jgi:hypothetical protein